MSSRYPVQFKPIERDRFELNRELLELVENTIALIRRHPDLKKETFLFRSLPSNPFPRKPPFGFDAQKLFTMAFGIREELGMDEVRFCENIQKLIDGCQDLDMIKKALGTAFERYILMLKTATFTDEVYFNSNVFVKGAIVEYQGYRSIDIGVDHLDSREYLELCECCLTISGFKRKDTQIGFYAQALKEIRSVVGTTDHLRIELCAASPGGTSWEKIIIPYLSDLKKSDVSVVGDRKSVV